MQTKVQKWGNSLALRIPKVYAEQMNITANSAVELTIHDDQIIISPLAAPVYSLDALLVQVNDDNIHSEMDTGSSVGNEAW